MSLATHRGDGEGAFERFRYRFCQSQPFLRRNVYKSQQSLNMGSAISSLTGASVGLKSYQEPVIPSDEEDDEDLRPAKRRKMSTFDPPNIAARFPSESPRRKPFGHVTNESRRAQSRLLGKLQAVQPAAFYGKSRSATPAFAWNPINIRPDPKISHSPTQGIDNLLPETPIDFRKALQIRVVGIEAKDGDEEQVIQVLDGLRGPLDIKCRCTIQLYYEKPSTPLNSKPESSELFRKSQTCILRTALADNDSVSRELVSLDPFLITAEEIFINRKQSSPLGNQDYTFDLADKYIVGVTLEPVGFQKHWPPLDITPLVDSCSVSDELYAGRATRKELSLFCSTAKLLDPNHQNRVSDLKLCCDKYRQKLPFGLRMQMQWSMPSHLSDLPIRTPSSGSPRIERTINAVSDVVPASPSPNKAEYDSAANSPAKNRTQRRRSNIPTYNLKTLSAQAQGKSPRKKNRSRSDQDDSTRVSVTYCMGKADATEYGTRQQTSVSGLFCPFCSCDKGSLEDLRLHLQSEHTAFKFTLRGVPSRPKIFVELAKQRTRPNPIPEKYRTFQMGKPQTLFNLEKFLNGDDSWAKSREGPLHNLWPEHLNDRFHESSSSPNDSRHSSPNTSNDTDGMGDHDHEKRLPMRTPKTFYVPKTNKPLYHSITKQILKPGQELPSSDDEKDEGWLMQKHRDIIMDFADVSADEKDFIIRWNPFIMEAQLTSEKYFPQAILRFADENSDWILRKRSRKYEFNKVMETLVMRGVLKQDEHYSKAVGILRDAARAAREIEKEDINMDEEEQPISPPRQRGGMDCICGEHTHPPDRIICSNDRCTARHFHIKCAVKSGRPVIRGWACDRCIS